MSESKAEKEDLGSGNERPKPKAKIKTKTKTKSFDLEKLKAKVKALQQDAFRETMKDIQRLLCGCGSNKDKNNDEKENQLNSHRTPLAFGSLFELLFVLECNCGQQLRDNYIAVATRTIGASASPMDVVLVNPKTFCVASAFQLKCTARYTSRTFYSPLADTKEPDKAEEWKDNNKKPPEQKQKNKYQDLVWVVPRDTFLSAKKRPPQLQYSRFFYEDVRAAFLDPSLLVTRLRVFDMAGADSSLPEFAWFANQTHQPAISKLVRDRMHQQLKLVAHKMWDFCCHRFLPPFCLLAFFFVLFCFYLLFRTSLKTLAD
jgi:hypothetical protein